MNDRNFFHEWLRLGQNTPRVRVVGSAREVTTRAGSPLSFDDLMVLQHLRKPQSTLVLNTIKSLLGALRCIQPLMRELTLLSKHCVRRALDPFKTRAIGKTTPIWRKLGTLAFSSLVGNYTVLFDVQSLSHIYASDCKTELSRRNILADSGTDQTVQRTLVAE